jgi:hypothetical protein
MMFVSICEWQGCKMCGKCGKHGRFRMVRAIGKCREKELVVPCLFLEGGSEVE